MTTRNIDNGVEFRRRRAAAFAAAFITMISLLMVLSGLLYMVDNTNHNLALFLVFDGIINTVLSVKVMFFIFDYDEDYWS